jgi:hypothetical protein
MIGISSKTLVEQKVRAFNQVLAMISHSYGLSKAAKFWCGVNVILATAKVVAFGVDTAKLIASGSQLETRSVPIDRHHKCRLSELWGFIINSDG